MSLIIVLQGAQSILCINIIMISVLDEHIEASNIIWIKFANMFCAPA